MSKKYDRDSYGYTIFHEGDKVSHETKGFGTVKVESHCGFYGVEFKKGHIMYVLGGDLTRVVNYKEKHE